MEKNYTVRVITKDGRDTTAEHVTKIDYNFNHGTMLSLSYTNEDDKRCYMVVDKSVIHTIHILDHRTYDDGNDQPPEEEENSRDLSLGQRFETGYFERTDTIL